VHTPVSLYVATSNAGKLREYRDLAAGRVSIEPVPQFQALPLFEEAASTFSENSAGKALHYSLFTDEMVIADDSGLVVPALGGAPGVHSARYAGRNTTDADRVRKLLAELRAKTGTERAARFVCVLTLAQQGRALAVLSASAEGVIAEKPRGSGGFGYDPVFYFERLGRTYAELTPDEKNEYSHRGRAFRKLLALLFPSPE